MKIISKPKKQKKLRGRCQHCGCLIECSENEATLLVDRDSPEGAYHVKCPSCGNGYLWVS